MLEIYRSSRIESLAELLGAHLHQQRPASVLAAQTLIVGHLGMKRWLLQFLADQRWPELPRIAANLDMLLPSEWLDTLAQQVLQTEAIAIAPYRRAALRWRIFELLPTLDAAEVAGYLEGEDAARRRFQLADRLAGLYGQYLSIDATGSLPGKGAAHPKHRNTGKGHCGGASSRVSGAAIAASAWSN